jgi:hypothetical protein
MYEYCSSPSTSSKDAWRKKSLENIKREREKSIQK